MGLPLQSNYDIVKRKVTGSIDVEYDWIPDPMKEAPAMEDEVMCHKGSLFGTLRLSLKCGSDLVNLNLQSKSNPFALVFCYPNSPGPTPGPLRPCVWRSPVAQATINPQWNVCHDFIFHWSSFFKQASAKEVKALNTHDFGSDTKFNEAMDLMQKLVENVKEVHSDLKTLTQGVDGLANAQGIAFPSTI